MTVGTGDKMKVGFLAARESVGRASLQARADVAAQRQRGQTLTVTLGARVQNQAGFLAAMECARRANLPGGADVAAEQQRGRAPGVTLTKETAAP
jgi:hypothetical protein